MVFIRHRHLSLSHTHAHDTHRQTGAHLHLHGSRARISHTCTHTIMDLTYPDHTHAHKHGSHPGISHKCTQPQIPHAHACLHRSHMHTSIHKQMMSTCAPTVIHRLHTPRSRSLAHARISHMHIHTSDPCSHTHRWISRTHEGLASQTSKEQCRICSHCFLPKFSGSSQPERKTQSSNPIPSLLYTAGNPHQTDFLTGRHHGLFRDGSQGREGLPSEKSCWRGERIADSVRGQWSSTEINVAAPGMILNGSVQYVFGKLGSSRGQGTICPSPPQTRAGSVTMEPPPGPRPHYRIASGTRC